MSSEFELEPPEPPRSRLGCLIVLGALGVAVMAAVLAGVVLDNALGGRVRDRAIWGVLLMALGAAAPVVAVVALVRRRQIGAEVRERHWGAVAFFPGSFVVAWVGAVLGYGILGSESNEPIISHTPSFIITFGPDGNVSFNQAGAFSGSSETRGGAEFEYRAHAGARGIAIAFEGTIDPPDVSRTVEVRATLVLSTKTRVRVVGLSGGTLTIDDRPREYPVDLEAGRYQIVIRGTPRGE